MAHCVSEIMDPDFFSACQTDSIGKLLHDMAELGLGSAPVLDLQGHPLGMATLRDIDGCRRLDELPEHIRQPAISVHQSTGIEEAARALVSQNADCLILVDDRGVAVGALRSLDLLRAVLGQQLKHAGTKDPAAHDAWSRGALLDVDAAHHAPAAPGVILLGPGEPGEKVNFIWAEATPNIRERLDEMLRMPQAEPALEAELGQYPRRVTFRALVVSDPGRQARLVRALRALDRLPRRTLTASRFTVGIPVRLHADSLIKQRVVPSETFVRNPSHKPPVIQFSRVAYSSDLQQALVFAIKKCQVRESGEAENGAYDVAILTPLEWRDATWVALSPVYMDVD